jgi:hypothetical protein
LAQSVAIPPPCLGGRVFQRMKALIAQNREELGL